MMSNDGMKEHDERIPPMMLADGFERAFIGISEDYAGHPRAVYDYGKCLRILMIEQHMTQDEAVEYMDFNVIGAYVGAGTPHFLHRQTYRQMQSDFGLL